MSPLILLSLCACERPAEVLSYTVDLGRYYALPPAGWDGRSALPMALHFHGWTGSPAQYYNSEEVTGAFSDAGILLLLPEGIDGTWTVDNMGLEGSDRDELAFVAQVMDDAARRWPIDPERVYASGFSLGASLAHTVACEQGGDRFTAVSPMSGGFWEPLPGACAGGAIPICHVHGTADTTWPMEGREVSEGSVVGTQVPIEEDIALWRAHDGCSDRSRVEIQGPLTCTIWDDCAEGSAVELCTHDGGHERIEGWAERAIAWFSAAAP